MTNINPQTRNKRVPLSERINNFIGCAVHCGFATRDSLTRKEVYSICEQTDIVYPRWLAKNPDRRLGRGEYSFPELAAAGVSTVTLDDVTEDDQGSVTIQVPESMQSDTVYVSRNADGSYDFSEDDPQTDLEKQAHGEMSI
jgi:hypothetical protein